jgi:hypothetical protein
MAKNHRNHNITTEMAGVRGIRREQAKADGSFYIQPRATRIADGRKKASKNACRKGKYGYMDH